MKEDSKWQLYLPFAIFARHHATGYGAMRFVREPAMDNMANINMPSVGIGGWAQKKDGILAALSLGYRLIDTAAQYGNEGEVGAAIASSGVPRRGIFLTTKLWTEDIRRGRAREALHESLGRLRTDYVDLYLIHWPAEGFEGAWIVMEELYHEGLCRSIGVSNFEEHHLDALRLKGATVVPAANQIESHPYFSNREMVDACKKRGIRPMAWCPIGGPGSLELSDKVIIALSHKYGKSPAQIILRWHLQRGVAVIPKSSKLERMRENMDVFDFELTAEDMAKIGGLERGIRLGAHPDHFDF